MKVFLRVPMQDAADKAVVRWLLWLTQQPEARGWDVDLHDACGWGVANARNDIVRAFLASDATHLWMLDSDVEPPRSLHLLQGADSFPALAGVYMGTTPVGLRWHVYKHRGAEGWSPLHPRLAPQERYFPVDAAGTGCLLLRRSLIEGLSSDPFEFRRGTDGVWRGEDLLFGERIGGLMADTQYVCEHYRRTPLVHIWAQGLKDYTCPPPSTPPPSSGSPASSAP